MYARSHIALFATWLCLAGAQLAGAQLAGAQTLDPALCPAGSPFDIRPSGWSPYSGSGAPMRRLTLDPALYPDAVCNDGSPAVMYVRPSNFANPNDPDGDRWLIFFDGGGGCRDEDACLLDRWCSGSPEIFSRAGKMSSLGAWPAIDAPGGIWNENLPGGRTNAFADYNAVLVHYCSSDNWVGSETHTGISASSGATFDIEFRGEAIINAVIETLLAGPTVPDASPLDAEFPYLLPDLHDADEVLLGAESAGANGLRHHVDRLHDWLESVSEAQVRAVLDAAFTPWDGDGGIAWGSAPWASYSDFLLGELEPVLRGFWGAEDSALDASCLDPIYQVAHDAVGIHPQICYDTNELQLDHITTPLFQRMDVDDPLGKQRYGAWGLFTTVDDYWTAAFGQLVLFSAYSPAGGGLEAPEQSPGLQVPNCARHVAVQSNAGFFRDRVRGPAWPLPLSFHDLLVNWIAGLSPGPDTQQFQEDNLGVGAWSGSDCF